jgi:hypothetical protein
MTIETRGVRVVEVDDREFEALRSGNTSVLVNLPGLPVFELLASLTKTSRSRPAGSLRVTSHRDRVNPLGPLFTPDDFNTPVPGPETASKLRQLVDCVDLWCCPGRLGRVSSEDGEGLWWPRPRQWTPRTTSADPTVRLGIGAGEDPLLRAPALYVAAEWPEGSSVRRLLGIHGNPRSAHREQEAEARIMAVLNAARAPSVGTTPLWWLRADRVTETETVAVLPALDMVHTAIDSLIFEDLRNEVDQHFPSRDRLPEPKVALMWRFEFEQLAGLDIQAATELASPALTLARLACEETLRPFSKPSALLKAVRAGISLVDDIKDYPTGWTEPADPVDVLEMELLAAATAAPAHLVAHGLGWMRQKTVGLTGAVELLRGGR